MRPACTELCRPGWGSRKWASGARPLSAGPRSPDPVERAWAAGELGAASPRGSGRLCWSLGSPPVFLRLRRLPLALCLCPIPSPVLCLALCLCPGLLEVLSGSDDSSGIGMKVTQGNKGPAVPERWGWSGTQESPAALLGQGSLPACSLAQGPGLPGDGTGAFWFPQTFNDQGPPQLSHPPQLLLLAYGVSSTSYVPALEDCRSSWRSTKGWGTARIAPTWCNLASLVSKQLSLSPALGSCFCEGSHREWTWGRWESKPEWRGPRTRFRELDFSVGRQGTVGEAAWAPRETQQGFLN